MPASDNMIMSMPHLVFLIEEHTFAVPVAVIRQIIRSVKVTFVPNGPPLLLGVINIHGKIVPVFDIRKQLNLPVRQMQISDRIIVLELDTRLICFVSDEIDGVIELSPETAEDASGIHPEMADHLLGISKKNGRNVLIYDTGKLFPADAVQAITDRIEQIGDIEKTL